MVLGFFCSFLDIFILCFGVAILQHCIVKFFLHLINFNVVFCFLSFCCTVFFVWFYCSQSLLIPPPHICIGNSVTSFNLYSSWVQKFVRVLCVRCISCSFLILVSHLTSFQLRSMLKNDKLVVFSWVGSLIINLGFDLYNNIVTLICYILNLEN